MGPLVVTKPSHSATPEGVVGQLAKGSWQGYYILLERLTEQDWLVYWRNPDVPDSAMRLGEDVGDTLLGSQEQAESFLRDSDVQWLPSGESDVALARYFSYAPEPAIRHRRLPRWLNPSRWRRHEGIQTARPQ